MNYAEEAKKIEVTPHFKLYELVRSATAAKHNLEDQFKPSEEIMAALKRTAEAIAEPIRQKIGQPITISSGYRSPTLNRLIGGAKRSDHSFGRALDLQLHLPGGKTNNRLIFETILELDLDFKQMIWEFGDNQEPRWIHIAYDPENNKRQILKAYKNGGRTAYCIFDPAAHGITVGTAKAQVAEQSNTDQPAPLEVDDKAEVTASTLNIRSGAGTNHNVVGQVVKGSLVEIDAIEGDWAKIETLGIAGWVHGDYIQREGEEGTVTASNLNIRDEASTAGDKVAPALPKGTVVKIKGAKGEWLEVTTKGMVGYVAMQYLEKAGELATDE